MKTAALAIVLLLAISAFGQAKSDTTAPDIAAKTTHTCHFSVMVMPGWWATPKHGKPISRRPFITLEHHPALAGVYESEFRKGGKLFLPWYYTEQGRLMLYSFQFYFPRLFRFDADGKPFRYVAQAVGSHIGASSTASWTDRDGDGRFEEFAWTADVYGDLPDWVTARIHQSSGAPLPRE